MSKEHLQRLAWAQDEVENRVKELDEKKRTHEIGGIEHKILLHERLFGREKQELLGHIETQIYETKNTMREEREVKVVVIMMLFAMLVAFASTFYVQDAAPDAATGYVASEATQDIKLTDCWNNTPPEGSHTTPTECETAKIIEEK